MKNGTLFEVSRLRASPGWAAAGYGLKKEERKTPNKGAEKHKLSE
jgi:hypothetical protein